MIKTETKRPSFFQKRLKVRVEFETDNAIKIKLKAPPGEMKNFTRYDNGPVRSFFSGGGFPRGFPGALFRRVFTPFDLMKIVPHACLKMNPEHTEVYFRRNLDHFQSL
jgi:hypothetical protein